MSNIKFLSLDSKVRGLINNFHWLQFLLISPGHNPIGKPDSNYTVDLTLLTKPLSSAKALLNSRFKKNQKLEDYLVIIQSANSNCLVFYISDQSHKIALFFNYFSLFKTHMSHHIQLLFLLRLPRFFSLLLTSLASFRLNYLF